MKAGVVFSSSYFAGLCGRKNLQSLLVCTQKLISGITSNNFLYFRISLNTT